MRRRLAALVLASTTASGCLVVALDRFYEDTAIVFDERLIGTWKDADDNLTVTIERSDWRAYRLQYVHTTDTRVLSAYLFKVRETFYLDVSPLRGEDPGMFLLPAHTIVRLTIGDGEITASPLDFDWFSAALTRQALPADLRAARSERSQLVLAAERAVLVRWLAGRTDKDPAFGDPAVFKRELLRDLRHHPHHVVQRDAVPRLQILRHRVIAHTRVAQLLLGILRVLPEDVE